MKPEINSKESLSLLAEHTIMTNGVSPDYVDWLWLSSYGLYFIVSLEINTECAITKSVSEDEAIDWLVKHKKFSVLKSHFNITLEVKMKDTQIKGNAQSRRVWIKESGSRFWKELKPEESLKYVRHSPDGFAWGYGGSGPSQLAFAILLELYNPDIAKRYYQNFKWAFVAKLETHEDFLRELPLPNLNQKEEPYDEN